MNSHSAAEVVGDRASTPARSGSRLRHMTFQALRQVIGRWRERSRQRRALTRLDDAALADMGLTRADLENEIAKPFWR